MPESQLWMVIVTCWPGPDDDHQLIVRLTLDAGGATDSVVVSSIGDACAQLRTWLTVRADPDS